jgi:4a-hydroxytetrahydrobiopterin dehydratase
MERKKLSPEEIASGLAGLDGWRAEDDKLLKSFKFSNFAGSLDFVNKAGALAERHDHHPDITFGWGYADFVITTHSEGGITALDFALAKEIEGIHKT